jgi:hypothetical protein
MARHGNDKMKPSRPRRMPAMADNSPIDFTGIITVEPGKR